MSDPIERMNRLRSDVEGGPMLPAAAVRRRGDRLRRRRTAAMTAGAALAVVAIVAPVAFLTGGDPSSDSTFDPVDTPSETRTSTPAYTATLSKENLLRNDDTVFTDDVRWSPGETRVGVSDDSYGPCLEDSLADLGASAAFERSWYVDSGIHSLGQVVAEFPTAGAARTAYDEIAVQLADCQALTPDNRYDASRTAVEIAPEGDAEVSRATYDLDPDRTADQGGEAYYQVEQHAGLAVSDNRITLLRHQMPESENYDNTWWGQTSPVELMLRTAAERLVIDAGTDQPSTDWRTDIPAGFPIDRSLSSPEGDPISGPGPDANGINRVDICAAEPGASEIGWPPAYEERLAASATGPEYLDARELVTLANAEEASGVLSAFRQMVESCAASDGQVWTIHDGQALGDETLYLSRTYDFGLGGDIYVFVRVGNAILAVDAGGEWDLASTVPAGIEDVAEKAAAIVPDMCIFAADGC